MPVKFENTRKDLNNLLARRSNFLAEAEQCRGQGDITGYQAALKKAKDLNPEIDDKKALIDEVDRYANAHAPKFGSGRQDREEMGRALAAGERVKIDMLDVVSHLRRNEGIPLSSAAAPVGAGSDIHSGFAGQVSGLISQVHTVDLVGLSGWEEPYVLSAPQATAGDPVALAGTTRQTTDPEFALAGMTAYEANTTSFVPKAAANLSPARYAEKVQEMALQALKRKVVALMINGDGGAAPKMHGILNAKNTAGRDIFATVSDVAAIDENTLARLMFSYGGDEMAGGFARLLLTKANLEAFGKLASAGEKTPLYEIAFDPGSGGNTGTIKRGGLIAPYTICSAVGEKKLAYGDPFNYMLALFSDYVVHTDPSYKAGERLITVLGDVLMSGNLTVDKGMSVATLGA